MKQTALTKDLKWGERGRGEKDRQRERKTKSPLYGRRETLEEVWQSQRGRIITMQTCWSGHGAHTIMLSWLKVTVQVTIRVMVPASWGSVLVYLGSNSILKKERSTNVTVPTSKASY